MYDIVIIGGGINGCGIARDAAGRGLKVLLAEMNDLASGTSSWSTKLIHGGLRYLEHFEFGLVREALSEREVLWNMAPHIIQPARFVLPHHDGLRPAWQLRLGLFIYDHLGGRKELPSTRTLDLREDEAGGPLKDVYRRGFEFSDCRVDDARLVILNARDAAERGAEIRTRSTVVEAKREGDHWQLVIETDSGKRSRAKARLLVNAAGPWVDRVLRDTLGRKDASNVRLVRGSHIVVPKLYAHDRSYLFQNTDGRVVFAIPFEEDFTLIGTTDVDHDGNPGDATITPEEEGYLCETVSSYFSQTVSPDQVVWSFSGVRPLFDDNSSKAQEVTRDYVLKSDGGGEEASLINIFGGKLTTYRRLAEEVTDIACARLGVSESAWTRGVPLPGGEFPGEAYEAEFRIFRTAYDWLAPSHARRLFSTYGMRACHILEDASKLSDLGTCFGDDLTEAEIDYLRSEEWARTAKDILWRRTKLGLTFSNSQSKALENWLLQKNQ